jgi:hypothetical protein
VACEVVLAEARAAFPGDEPAIDAFQRLSLELEPIQSRSKRVRPLGLPKGGTSQNTRSG